MRKLLILFALLITTCFPPPAGATSILSLTGATYELNAYYSELFAVSGQEYRQPTVLILKDGEAYSGECGVAMDTEEIDYYAFYCPLDETVVVENQWMEELKEKNDEFVPMFILAHEFAHHAQNISGIHRETIPTDGDANEAYSIEIELMADCMAGSWAAYLESVGKLDRSDMAAVLENMHEWGDIFSTPTSPGAHGSGLERVKAALTGYMVGPMGCMSLHPLPRGV